MALTDINEANKKIEELEKANKELQEKASASAEFKDFDPTKVPDDKILKVLEDPRIWKTKRLTDLRTKAEKVEALETKVKDLEGKAGTPDDQVQALKKEIDDLKHENKETKINTAITAAAVKAGVKNPGVIAKLIDRSGLTLGDDGSVTGADEQIAGLLKSDPYLKGDGKSAPVGNPTNPNPDDQGGKKLFKASEISDPTFYREHEKDIDKAIATGQIDDDLASQT
jgi:hypothetical protein